MRQIKALVFVAGGIGLLAACSKPAPDEQPARTATPFAYTLHYADSDSRVFAPGDTYTFEIVNRDASGKPVPVTKDVTCVLSTPEGVSTYVNEFNAKYDAQTLVLPASMYKVESVTMAAGQSSARIILSIKRENIARAARKNAYVLPLEIVSSDPALLSHDIRYVMVPGQSVNGAGQTVIHLSNAADTLVIHQVAKGASKAVVFFPGGGYEQLSSGKPTATEYPADLYTVATLYYRLPTGNLRGKYWCPMQDAEDAVDFMREHAADYGGYTQVGVAGRSAGGHLAGVTAAYNKEKVDFEILLYPVVNMDDGSTHDGSAKYFLGPLPSRELVDAYTVYKLVTPKTPRTYLAYSLDDYTVPQQYNGVPMAAALKENGVSAEIRPHDTGGHATSGWSDYPSSLQNWLKTF